MEYGIEPPMDLWRFNFVNPRVDDRLNNKIQGRLINVSVNEDLYDLILTFYDRDDNEILNFLNEKLKVLRGAFITEMEFYSREGVKLSNKKEYNLLYKEDDIIKSENENFSNIIKIRFGIVH